MMLKLNQFDSLGLFIQKMSFSLQNKKKWAKQRELRECGEFLDNQQKQKLSLTYLAEISYVAFLTLTGLNTVITGSVILTRVRTTYLGYPKKKQRIVLEIWHCTNKQVTRRWKNQSNFTRKKDYFLVFSSDRRSIFCCFVFNLRTIYWWFNVHVYHPEETSKNSDICDFFNVSDIENEW